MSSETNSEDYLSTRARIRISDLREAKNRGEKWAMLTSYDATSAKIFDMAKIPVLLIGDSAAQAVFGYKSTLPITMDEMIPLARAVASSCQRALVIADMPFGSYQESPQQALKNATRFMKEALVHGVKIEGGGELFEHVKLLTSAGIPVMAHVGLTPQSEHTLSGYKIQARDVDARQALVSDVEILERAGAFACVVELVPSIVGAQLQCAVKIPIIGIGAGPKTDAQILVWTDMVGFSPPKGLGSIYLAGTSDVTSSITSAGSEQASKRVEGSSNKETSAQKDPLKLEIGRVPKFVKRYANVSEIVYRAALAFASDVRSGQYPSEEHCYE